MGLSRSTKPRPRRTSCLMVLLALCLWANSVRADGKVFPAIAFPADVKIPDQSALLIWSNGVEQLVIETRFIGEGTNFAWVVPLPSAPEIEPATVGLFPTLRYSFQPELRHHVYSWWGVALFVCGLAWLLATVRRDQPRRVSDLLACLLTAGGFAVASHSPDVAAIGGPLMFLLLLVAAKRVRGGKERIYAFLICVVIVLVLAAMLLPALAKGRSAAVAGGDNGVQVLDRKIVGVFDTTTITAKKADALVDWLKDNGFAVNAEAKPVIEAHVREGWVFVATKVHREANSTAPATPHPLSFTFNTAKPIYPLRLTGVGNRELSVELFVAGAERASIKGFKVTECRQIEPSTYAGEWQNRGFRKLKHPQFLAWAGNAPVLTRLEARLDAAALRKDAEVTWRDFSEVRSHLYSTWGAAQTAANWTVPFAAFAVLLVSFRAHQGRMPSRRATKFGLGAIIATGLMALVIYAVLPKVPVRMQRMPRMMSHINLRELALICTISHPTNQPVTLDSVRKEIASYLEQKESRRTENTLLGGRIREEDSPGNYSLRLTAEGVEILGHDTTGAAVPLSEVENSAAK